MEQNQTSPDDFLRNLNNQIKLVGGLGLCVLVPDGATLQSRRLLLTTHPAWADHIAHFVQSHFSPMMEPEPFHPTIHSVRLQPGVTGHHGWLQTGIAAVGIVSHVLPGGRSIDVLVPALRELHRDDLAAISRLIHGAWYGLKHYVFRPLSGITPQQGKVLELALEGHSVKETAEAMALTERTVNHHLTQLQARLNTSGKTQSIVKAIWLGAL